MNSIIVALTHISYVVPDRIAWSQAAASYLFYSSTIAAYCVIFISTHQSSAGKRTKLRKKLITLGMSFKKHVIVARKKD